MSNNAEITNVEDNFFHMLNVAANIPGVHIDREKYLRSALQRYCTDEQIEQAIAQNPAAAGVPSEAVSHVANAAINLETAEVTGTSALAGMPGGIAMVGTIPADMTQYTAHILRIAQKLAYIYGWPDLFPEGGEVEPDDAVKNVLVLFIGVMYGVEAAQGGIAKAAALIAANAAKKLPQQALTKGAIYPMVKQVAKFLGVHMNKKIFAGGVAKAIPVVGAVVSGGLTYAMFMPMSKRLQSNLADLELAQSGMRAAGTVDYNPEVDDISVEVLDVTVDVTDDEGMRLGGE